jgi:hypothetical protein
MDDRRFDAFTRRLGSHSSRRSILKGLLGVGGIAATGAVIHGQTEAARRGFSGPSFPFPSPPTPSPTPVCIPDGGPCTGATVGDCCSNNGCCIDIGQTVGICLGVNEVCVI